jgi:sugar lactone lactonase YvrE
MIRSSSRALGALLAVAVAAALALSHDASAVVTARWVVDGYTEWDAGDGESVLITSEGEVKPGWKTDRTNLEVDATWAAVRGTDGSVYLGTDDDGAIYRIAGGKASKLTSIKGAIAVVSLAVAKDGSLYAGTMPGGEVWKVSSSGKAQRLVALEGAETVWALALAKDGKSLYAGTGPKGELFRIDLPGGKARVAFATEDKRVMAVTATDDGAVWMGTSEKAMVFRYDPDKGTARAMADFDGNEVTALAATRGGVVAVANNFTEPTGTGARTADAAKKGTPGEKKKDKGEKAKPPKAGSKPGADAEEPANAKLPRPGARKGKGAVYRIDGDGSLEQLHALTATYFTSVAVDGDGKVFAGAGDKGRVYLIDTDDSVSTAFDANERQVAHVLADENGLAFTTADGAAFYRATGAADKAVYTSKVQDTDASSRFGRISWHSNGKMKMETRTGNTAEPGIGWSKWAAPAKVSRGGGESTTGSITSPPGRYIQFRVTFQDRDAALRSASVYHLPRNRATKISSIKIDGGNDKLVTNKVGAKPRSPVLKVTWEIDNPDKDETVYELAVRREGDVRWRALVTKDGNAITKKEYEWNTETFPDGYYQLRVEASDRPANAGSRALEFQRTTPLFLVDNTKPQLSGVTVRYPNVSARATDGMSAIAEAAYSIDDGSWQLASPDDGLFDELSELLTFKLPGKLAPGAHTLSIRVADEAGNIGSASVTFRIE